MENLHNLITFPLLTARQNHLYLSYMECVSVHVFVCMFKRYCSYLLLQRFVVLAPEDESRHNKTASHLIWQWSAKQRLSLERRLHRRGRAMMLHWLFHFRSWQTISSFKTWCRGVILWPFNVSCWISFNSQGWRALLYLNGLSLGAVSWIDLLALLHESRSYFYWPKCCQILGKTL